METLEKNKRPLNLHFAPKHDLPQTPERRLHKSATQWGKVQAQHLLMRSGFGASHEETIAASSISRDELIHILLADFPLPDPPGDWVNQGYNYRSMTPQERNAFNRANRAWRRDTVAWWLNLMAKSPYNLRESMTLFWHNHFVIEAAAVKSAHFLYKYIDMLRRNALGNFRTFLKEMWRDPAMLIYLNGAQNTKNRPNENFARELLELFTMGVDQYTEDDIREAARALTGWRVNTETLSSFFTPNLHSGGSKTFLGKTGAFQGDDIVDMILEQEITANFICRKIYRNFVSFEENEERIAELAGVFRNSDYEIKPVLEAIFKSDYFYDEENVGSLIKSPLKLAISAARQFGAVDVDLGYIYNASSLLDQTLLDPPNVAGWAGQRSWISPLTLATRGAFGESVILGGRIDSDLDRKSVRPIDFDVMQFARSFDADVNPRLLLQRWVEHLSPVALDPLTFELMLEVMLDGANEDDWSLYYEGVEDRVKTCLTQLLRLPEYQLH